MLSVPWNPLAKTQFCRCKAAYVSVHDMNATVKRTFGYMARNWANTNKHDIQGVWQEKSRTLPVAFKEAFPSPRRSTTFNMALLSECWDRSYREKMERNASPWPEGRPCATISPLLPRSWASQHGFNFMIWDTQIIAKKFHVTTEKPC